MGPVRQLFYNVYNNTNINEENAALIKKNQEINLRQKTSRKNIPLVENMSMNIFRYLEANFITEIRM